MQTDITPIGGVPIEYRLVHPRTDTVLTHTDTVLVFLHEGLGCVKAWRDFPTALADQVGLSTLIYSRPGYGGSASVELPRPADYMQQEGLVGLAAVLDHFNVEDVILFGHSDGASIALVAASGPLRRRIRGVIALAPHVVIEDITVRGIAELARNFESGDLKTKMARYHGSSVDCAFWGFANTWLTERNAQSWTIVSLLPRIRCPVLLMQGEQDTFGTQHQIDLIKANVAGRADILMLPNCGHWPHIERPDQVIEQAATFIKDLAVRL